VALARAQAASQGTTVALRFEMVAARAVMGVFADGNRNGVRTVEIDAGVDRAVTAPVVFSDLFPGVTLVFSDVATGIFSFTPVGTATPGTVEVHGPGGNRFGVRILGDTARSRVLRYDVGRREWIDGW
jgi:hypothetical protein